MTTNENKSVPNSHQRAKLELALATVPIPCSWDYMRGFTKAASVYAWNPYDDFNDAMDLASRLNMSFQVDDKGVRVWVGETEAQELTADVFPALRRLIVDIAAKLGENCTNQKSLTAGNEKQ
jgi:hypothetical protein